jgi:catechol 2,3-dioxygenase-like lactoylglutathione lyase family enzyme
MHVEAGCAGPANHNGGNNMSTELGLSTVGQIAIRVKDLQRATDFYRDNLGMKFLFTVNNLSFFDCDGVRLMLDVPENKEFDHPSSIIYFKVPDIQEAFQTLSGRGVKFEEEPGITARMPSYNLWMAFLRDSENNVLSIMCEVPT